MNCEPLTTGLLRDLSNINISDQVFADRCSGGDCPGVCPNLHPYPAAMESYQHLVEAWPTRLYASKLPLHDPRRRGL